MKLATEYVKTGPTRPHESYIGGSDIAALAGANPYRTPLDVWAEKMGKSSFEGNLATELGDHMERPTLELYRRRQGVKTLEYPGTLVHPQLPYLGATPDAIRDGRRDVQCKIVGFRQAFRWGDVADGPEAIPQEVYLQVQWESWACKYVLGLDPEVADVPALIGTDLRTYEIPIDWQLIEGLEVIAMAFWLDHVETGIMPEATGQETETLRDLFPKPTSDELGAPSAEMIELAHLYDVLRAEESTAKKGKKVIAAKLCAQIGEQLGFQGDGVRVKWPERDGKTDWQKLAGDYRAIAKERGADPDTLAKMQHNNTGAPNRSLDVKIGEKYQ